MHKMYVVVSIVCHLHFAALHAAGNCRLYWIDDVWGGERTGASMVCAERSGVI